jgi:hypothetical protein
VPTRRIVEGERVVGVMKSAAAGVGPFSDGPPDGGRLAHPVATNNAINDIKALAARATNPTEKKDLTTLADTMDAAVMAGGSFSDWDPAFEAFHVKYGPGCGQVVLTPSP